MGWGMGGAVAAVMAAADAGAAALADRGWVPALGGRPDPELMARSARFRDGMFHNLPSSRQSRATGEPATVKEFLTGGQRRRPAGPIPLVRPQPGASRPGSLHITWFGHASSLVEIDGVRVLFDPVWSERVSPFAGIGPRRLHPPPHELAELPPLDVIVISHDHYDHLDMHTVLTLASAHAVPFLVPLGVGAHLRRWRIPEERIIELDWAQSVELAGLRLTAAPAQHFSGRSLARNTTLWASWVVAGPNRKVFYTGDSGYFDGYSEIGAEHGPFDATLVQVGAYNARWADIHMTPEDGVAAHLDLRGGLMVPVHWGTFALALHDWAEPAERVLACARARDVVVAVPKPGERINVDAPPEVESWWRALAPAVA